MEQPSTADLRSYPGLNFIEVSPTLALRSLAVTDADALLAILDKDPTIRQRVYIASLLHTPEDVAQQVAASNDSADLNRYVIIADQQLAGIVSFWADTGYFGQDPLPHSYGFGFFCGPQFRGLGLVTQCVAALMEVAPRLFRVDRFMAFCQDDNPASQAVLTRVGMHPTDTIWFEPIHGWTERMYVRECAA